jgi:hypothetical protein
MEKKLKRGNTKGEKNVKLKIGLSEKMFFDVGGGGGKGYIFETPSADTHRLGATIY